MHQECENDKTMAKERLDAPKHVYITEMPNCTSDATACSCSPPFLESLPACCVHLFVSDLIRLCKWVSSSAITLLGCWTQAAAALVYANKLHSLVRMSNEQCWRLSRSTMQKLWFIAPTSSKSVLLVT